MKAIYKKPETNVVYLKIEHLLQQQSSIAEGNAYREGDVVLSRDRGGSFFDDDEDWD